MYLRIDKLYNNHTKLYDNVCYIKPDIIMSFSQTFGKEDNQIATQIITSDGCISMRKGHPDEFFQFLLTQNN